MSASHWRRSLYIRNNSHPEQKQQQLPSAQSQGGSVLKIDVVGFSCRQSATKRPGNFIHLTILLLYISACCKTHSFMCYYVYTQITLTTLIINHPNILAMLNVCVCVCVLCPLYRVWCCSFSLSLSLSLVLCRKASPSKPSKSMATNIDSMFFFCSLSPSPSSFTAVSSHCMASITKRSCVCVCVRSLFRALIFHSVAIHLSFCISGRINGCGNLPKKGQND